jgi:hypothetical protein
MSDIDHYVSALPLRENYVERLVHNNFEQAAIYAEKKNPIKEVDRLYLKFKCSSNPSDNNNLEMSTLVNTYSLWSIIAGLLDDTHLLGNSSMKRCNIQYITSALKEFLSDKTMHSFLTGRRVYPIMELLDKPRVLFEKKHQSALGYFLSFLLNKPVVILDNEYRWTRELESEDTINLSKNKDGFWKQNKN